MWRSGSAPYTFIPAAKQRGKAPPENTFQTVIRISLFVLHTYLRMVTLILDGGLGHYLKDKGIHEIKNLRFDQLSIAGALANLERPELVLQAHNDFIEAGADVITTNTFSCTAHSMSSIGQSHGYGLDLAAAAGKLA